MSSVTQYRVTMRMQGAEVLDLTRQLGEQGCRLFEQTLKNTESGWHLVPDADNERVYRLEVVQGLPAGVTSLAVDLHLRNDTAEVRHRWTYQDREVRTSTQAAAVPQAIAETMTRMVGRSVNMVLMHTVVNELKTKIETQPNVSRNLNRTLDTYVMSAQRMQLHMKMRQRNAL